MADTQFLDIPADDWVDISTVVGGVGLVTNIGERTLTWVRTAVKPPVDFKDGHHLFHGQPLDYAVEVGETLWMRAQHFPGRIAASSGLAVSTRLRDGNGNPLSSYYAAATDSYVLNIHDAHVHNQPINQFFHQHTGVDTTLAVATNPDGSDYQIEVVDSSVYLVGDVIQIGGHAAHADHKFEILAIDGVNDILTLDSRVDFGWGIGTPVWGTDIDLNKSGTQANPQEFVIRPNAGQVLHLTRILVSMTHGSSGDPSEFGDLAELNNGVLLRVNVDGQYGTFTNWKNNADIKNDMYDVDFQQFSFFQGTYGTFGRGSFDRIGVAVRLDGRNGADGDFMELYIQDDLTGLDSFRIKAQGHIEAG